MHCLGLLRLTLSESTRRLCSSVTGGGIATFVYTKGCECCPGGAFRLRGGWRREGCGRLVSWARVVAMKLLGSLVGSCQGARHGYRLLS